MTQKSKKVVPNPERITIGNSVSIYDYFFTPQIFTMHWHDFYEFEIILSGSGFITCNNKKYEIKPGLVSFLSPIDFHEVNITSDIHVLCMQIHDDILDHDILELAHNLKENIIYSVPEKINRAASLFKVLEESVSLPNIDEKFSNTLSQSILYLFKKDFSATNIRNENTPSSIRKALSYINAHFKENPRMSEVAEMLYLNEHYFCTLFKESMGENYKDYLRNLKLKYSEKLIINSAIPITQIAFESGYSSQSNFNRDFKKFFGISPSEMRRQLKIAK